MAVERIVSSRLAPPNGHFSQAVSAPLQGRIVFVSGMTARAPDGTVVGVGDIEAQTHQVCQNIAEALMAAGGSMDDVARLDVYVRNIGDFETIHRVRRQYFTGVPPASTMVEVSGFVHQDYLIEINAIAVVDQAKGE